MPPVQYRPPQQQQLYQQFLQQQQEQLLRKILQKQNKVANKKVKGLKTHGGAPGAPNAQGGPPGAQDTLLPCVPEYPQFLAEIGAKAGIQQMFMVAPIIGDMGRYVELTKWHIGVVNKEKACNVLTYITDYDTSFRDNRHDPLLMLEHFWLNSDDNNKIKTQINKYLDCNGVRYVIPEEVLRLLSSQNQSSGMSHVTYEILLQAVVKFLTYKGPIKASNLTTKANRKGQQPTGDPYEIYMKKETPLFEFLSQFQVCTVKFCQDRWLLDQDVDEIVKLVAIATKFNVNPKWAEDAM